MKRMITVLAGVLLAGSALAAEEAKKPPCENFDWPMTQEIAAFIGPATPANSGDSLGAWPVGTIALALKPFVDSGLKVPPGRPPKDPTQASAGYIELPAPEAGVYQVTVAGKQWVDVIQDGKALESIAHGSDPTCTSFHKVVRFQLTDAPVTLQLSGEAADNVTFTILPGQ